MEDDRTDLVRAFNELWPDIKVDEKSWGERAFCWPYPHVRIVLRSVVNERNPFAPNQTWFQARLVIDDLDITNPHYGMQFVWFAGPTPLWALIHLMGKMKEQGFTYS